MKTAKRITCLLLAISLVLCLSVAAFADTTTPTYSITINNPKEGDTYSAWKIFDVSYNTDKTAYAYTIEKTENNSTATGWWAEVLLYMGGGTSAATEANGIYTGKGITLTKAAGTENTYVVTTGTYTEGSGDSAVTKSFSAPDFAQFLATKTTDKAANATGSTADANTPVVINLDGANNGPGYYLVTCSGAGHTTALAELTTAAPNVTITDKNVPPAFDKQQSDTGNAGYTDDPLDVQIGDTVNYKITSAVPDLTGYTAYTFEVSDILSEGLTLNMDSTDSNKPDVTIKVGDTAVQDWTVTAIKGTYDDAGNATESEAGSTVIGFRASTNLVGKNYAQGATIEITYSAVVNEKAVSGVETNKATLKYSNDPKDSSKTSTKTDETKVYDASIAVLKYDGATSDDGTTTKTPAPAVKYLSGAEFVLYRWALKDGTSNTLSFADSSGNAVTSATEGAVKAYYKYTAATSTEKAKVEWIAETSTGNGVPTDATIMVTNTEGKLTPKAGSSAPSTGTAPNLSYYFGGLEDGTYYLLETVAPAGYNLMEEAISVTVPGTGTDNAPVYAIEQPIANNAGTLLPSTGGMGTTIFYIIGSILVVGAVVVLVARKRMTAENEA